MKGDKRYADTTNPNYCSHGAETVPDTQDYILWDKIGKSIGVYSGVYEYTANTGTNTEYTEYMRYL